MSGGIDPGQWLGAGFVLGCIASAAFWRWWYRPVDLARYYPQGWEPGDRGEPRRATHSPAPPSSPPCRHRYLSTHITGSGAAWWYCFGCSRLILPGTEGTPDPAVSIGRVAVEPSDGLQRRA